MGGDDKFRIHALIFCVIVFVVLSSAHVLALVVKGDLEQSAIEEQLDADGLDPGFRAQLEANLENASNIDFWSVLGGFGNIMFGLDLPAEWAVVVTAVNSILLLYIALLAWSFIKAHIPLISG